MNLFLLYSAVLNAQTDTSKFERISSGIVKSAPFCEPFVSELENYKPQAAAIYASNVEEYDLGNTGKEAKLFQYIAAGFEVPFYRKYMYKGNQLVQAFACSAVFSFHLFWDPLELSKSPILNTDYRLGALWLKYIRFYEGSWLKNYSVKLSPINHESTHIGDDLTIYRIDQNYPITRVNVSYEYSEIDFTINDPNGSFEQNHSLRLGLLYRINKGDYYSINEKDGDPSLAKPSGSRTELFAGYNFIRSRGILTWKKWRNVISAEWRSRMKYNYPMFTTVNGIVHSEEVGQERVNHFALYFGYKHVKAKGPTIGMYLHAYTGLNPYGQFRNRSHFNSYGFTFIME
ncbi:MAG: hypothetical protein MUF75_09440 [Bacteroidia bacterium]|nr:hypothetical protein [Bacteroidia bacterium]